MPLSTKFAVTVTYANLMGHPSTEEELIQEVRKYQQDQLIHISCIFNHILDTCFGGVDEETHDVLIKT